MWLFVPDPDNDAAEGWTGTIEPPSGPGKLWTFEAVRHVDLDGLQKAAPFGSGLVEGLLNHQEPVTLINTTLHTLDPGSVGVRLRALRTRVAGEASAVLKKLAIQSRDEPVFRGYSVESPSFALWYGPPTFRSNQDLETLTSTISIAQTNTEIYDFADGLRIAVVTGTKVQSKGYDATLSSVAIMRVEFGVLKSLDEVMDLSLGLERLFGFLIGFRAAIPPFQVWTAGTYKVGDVDLPADGEILFGGVDWKAGDLPRSWAARHRRDSAGTGIEPILVRFLANFVDLLTRITAIERSEYFTTDIYERFANTMPLLEAHLKVKYVEPDEVSFMDLESRFFAWVDASTDPDIKAFSQKHIQVKARKAPSLKTLLKRAIAFVNGRGFAFHDDLADRIANRRGRVFHSPFEGAAEEIHGFYIEGLAVTNLLLLHTLDDLGVDIALLSQAYPSGSLREFIPKPVRSPEASNSDTHWLTPAEAVTKSEMESGKTDEGPQAADATSR